MKTPGSVTLPGVFGTFIANVPRYLVGRRQPNYGCRALSDKAGDSYRSGTTPKTTPKLGLLPWLSIKTDLITEGALRRN
jgi:hypothetical protein